MYIIAKCGNNYNIKEIKEVIEMTKKKVKEITTKEEVKYEENSCFIPEALKGKMLYHKKINQTAIYFTLIKLIEEGEDASIFTKMYEEYGQIFIDGFSCLSKNRKAYILDKCNWKLETKLIEK